MPFNDVSDPELITHSAAMVVAFTPEVYAYLMSLFPTPESYAELHARLERGYPGFLKGEPEGVKAFEEDREAVKQFLNMLSGLARSAAIKDPTMPQKLGLVRLPAKNPSKKVILTQPHGFRIIYDALGNLFATVSKVQGAKGYQVWLCEGDPNVEGNWKLITSATNSRDIMLPNINRTTNNWLRIRAIRGRVTGPWSNFVSLPQA
ncbi:hypothetical protein KP004_19305 [Geomonas oryzisoli]|uniref:Uncharacterized protein n=1 Tax=Geomonas oryzisoli TaxID=2847992 RepID=A0ABX8J7G6_9BACT|nr:hypothetical protein [Geomonas oryzisoli]QWV93287.1 hypothetical protein KP004_19305 [Geomonas oryzisoli]